MGSAHIKAATLVGLTAVPVDVEADISSGLPHFTVVGLPDAAVQEAKERVRSAIKNSGFSFPRTRITVNLAPADIKKQGPMFDLAIALSILAAQGELPDLSRLEKLLFVGELSLEGEIRPVRGILLATLLAKRLGLEAIIVANDNADEAALVENSRVCIPGSLTQIIGYLRSPDPLPLHTAVPHPPAPPREGIDMAHVRGQEHVKRALEIAAAGGHNILLSGPPGSGKTMIARALTTILPELTPQESLEVTAIHSVASPSGTLRGLITERPFRSPHHTTSGIALVGGGSTPRPGEVSLAHRGILFLDEFPEFARSVLESLRQPLEDGVITVSRASGTYQFPARLMLVAAMNPCPCGYISDPEKTCTCTPQSITKYQQKISGPLLERIDLGVEVPRVELHKLTRPEDSQQESSANIRARVAAARTRQHERYNDTNVTLNVELDAVNLKKFCVLNDDCRTFIERAAAKLALSARAYTRILKIARTIADLSGEDAITSAHLAEALQLRPRMTSG